MWPYFDHVVQMLQEIPAYSNLNGPQLFAAVFNRPKYIWMRRRNRVQQAVSWAIAEQTRVWIQKMGEKPRLGARPRFDFDVIDDLYNLIVAYEAGWANYFRENHIEPLILFYEDVVASNSDARSREKQVPDGATRNPPWRNMNATASSTSRSKNRTPRICCDG